MQVDSKRMQSILEISAFIPITPVTHKCNELYMLLNAKFIVINSDKSGIENELMYVL